MTSATPQRIVCLSAEVADWLWRIGAWDRVVGVTAFFDLPPGVPPKPRVSGFDTMRFEPLEQLNPDLIISFSDVQAGMAAELIRSGFNVLATNQRALAETEATLSLVARIVGREHEAKEILEQFREQLKPVEGTSYRPRVYFEEWNEPFISGIAWVGELIERAGGDEIFSELRTQRSARDRVVAAEDVIRADPEIIFASWCGKPVNPRAIATRPGWSEISAVRAGRIFEIPGEDILQPGIRLANGYAQLKREIAAVEAPATTTPLLAV
jgi:iron complex transport system substrate-binding protein